MYVNISTNGSLLPMYANKLVETGVDSITISVEGYNSMIHDRLVGMKRSFNKIQQGIALLKKIRAENNISHKLALL